MDELLNLGVSAREQMAWQERLANSAHQREIADLKAAGLNPVLSAGGKGAETPSGANDLSQMMNIVKDSINSSAKGVNNLVNKLPDIIEAATENIVKQVDKSQGYWKLKGLNSPLTQQDEMHKKGLYWNGKEYAPDSFIDIGEDNDQALVWLLNLGAKAASAGSPRIGKAMNNLVGKIKKGTIRQAIKTLSSTKNAYGYLRQQENIGDLWLQGL